MHGFEIPWNILDEITASIYLIDFLNPLLLSLLFIIITDLFIVDNLK